MNRSLPFFLSLALLGAGCQLAPPLARGGATILVSTEETPLKYCNGADMDSDGYRKTITKEQTVSVPSNQTESEHAKSVILAATTGMCQEALQQLDITVAKGTVRIPPINAWAGVSITLCSCKPLVEVNALRIPGIRNVEWNYAPTGPELDLRGRGLSAIPSDVFSRTDLERLDLSNNKLTGAPQAEIRHLQNLKFLDLSGNQLTGLPAELGQLKHLETLNVSNNKLTGLPMELGNLTQLRVLDLSGNSYSKQDLDQIAAKLINTEIRK